MRDMFPKTSLDTMNPDSSIRSRSMRRHTIAPAGSPSAPSSGGHVLPSADGAEQPPTSPTSHTSTSLSPSASNRSSALIETTDATSNQQTKRLSLNFPIQPTPDGRRPRPQSWIGTPTVPSLATQPSPTTGTFLTSLAAQERRVLELKEELQKAEQHLGSLKKQWAMHEGTKKRSDVRGGTHALQPLNTSLTDRHVYSDDSDGQSWRQKEMERRRAMISAPKVSSRKVFSGSRHTRQLSLLSPDKTFTPSFPQPDDVRDSATRPSPLLRSSTTPDLGIQPGDIGHHQEMNAMQGEDLLRSGKKMATDFKDGLWTFIEDLRQATVGDEAINGSHSRANPPTQIKKSARQPTKSTATSHGRGSSVQTQTSAPSKSENATFIDIGGSFWKEHGLEDPKAATVAGVEPTRAHKTPQKQIRKAIDDEGESWDTWDTPNDRRSVPSSKTESISDGRSTPRSARSTPRTSTSSTGNPATEQPDHRGNESIPWPALEKLSPVNLKRTASHLMREWEKSLAPPVHSQDGKSA